MNPVLLSNDHQLWFHPDSTAWPLQVQPAADFVPSGSSNLVPWSLSSTDGVSVEVLQNTPYMLPAASISHSDPPEGSANIDVSLSDKTSSSTAPQSPSSSISSQRDSVTDLQNYLKTEPATAKRLTQVYFVRVHPYWPILHPSSFGTAPSRFVTSASHVLIGSMLVLANWVEGSLDQVKLNNLVFDAIISSLLGYRQTFKNGYQPPSLHILQALVLSIVYCLCNITLDGMQSRATHLNGVLVSTCRQLGIFAGQQTLHDLGDCPFGDWTAQEQLHR